MRRLPLALLTLALSTLALIGQGCPSPSDDPDAGPASARADAGPQDAGVADPDDAGMSLLDAGVTLDDCGDDDPLTVATWAGFCDDRVDDNCTIDAPEEDCPFSVSVHHYCNTGDEPCPATQPGGAAPRWDCTGTVPRGVLAWAHLEAPTAQVEALCVIVYESSGVEGEFYVSVDLTPGPEPAGPDSACTADFIWRHYLFLSDLDDGECPPVTVDFPSAADDYRVSNHCRKAIRPIEFDDPFFDPDVQFFAFTEDEARAKIAVVESVEVGCLRAVDSDGMEVRPWVSQLTLPLTIRDP